MSEDALRLIDAAEVTVGRLTMTTMEVMDVLGEHADLARDARAGPRSEAAMRRKVFEHFEDLDPEGAIYDPDEIDVAFDAVLERWRILSDAGVMSPRAHRPNAVGHDSRFSHDHRTGRDGRFGRDDRFDR